MAALTFDDGPSKYTPQILDILERNNARATFCVVGNLLGARKDIVARAVSLGCEVIGHSWDHKNLTELTEDEIKAQLLDTASAVEAVTGVRTSIYRPPYGAVNDKLKEVSRELGFALINWSVDPEDWKCRDAVLVHDSIMARVKDKAIVLSHDLYASTAQAMERVIPELLTRGYRLVTVSELLSFTHDSLEPGWVYNNG
jgi:peptidoglycan/xylan/chitin deacetylase (PgdA/CDA1 family)